MEPAPPTIPPYVDATAPRVSALALLSADDAVCIDLRSPSEYADDHVPGAVNVALFDDDERALVGTLFKRHSPETAYGEAWRIVLAKIEPFVQALAQAAQRELSTDALHARVDEIAAPGLRALERSIGRASVPRLPARALVLYCWRGGLRSASVAVLLQRLGVDDVHVLEGGYKSYRRQVMDELAAWQAPPTFVLRGYTGVGKTLVLRELERLRPRWTLDLEACAGHRSSILGMVGLEPCSQRTFESRIAARLRAGFPGPAVLEGESRKVGDAIVPARVWSALDDGVNVLLTARTERRVQVLLEDYLEHAASRIELARQLPFIEERLGSRKWKGELVQRLADGREPELVELLLEHYYDPLYAHSEKGRAYALELDASDPTRAAAELAAWIEARSLDRDPS